MQYINTELNDNYLFPTLLVERGFKDGNKIIIPVLGRTIEPEGLSSELFHTAYTALEDAAEKCNIPVLPIYMFVKDDVFEVELLEDGSINRIMLKESFRIFDEVKIGRFGNVEREKFVAYHRFCVDNGRNMNNLENAYDFIIPGYECEFSETEMTEILKAIEKITTKEPKKRGRKKVSP